MFTYALVMFIIIGSLMPLTTATTIFRGHDFEMSADNASAFLHRPTNEDDGHFDKREIGRNCVLCKLGINPCCAPNVCVRKTLWFDECMEIKVPKPTFP